MSYDHEEIRRFSEHGIFFSCSFGNSGFKHGSVIVHNIFAYFTLSLGTSQVFMIYPLVTLSHHKHADCKFWVLSVHDKCAVFTLIVARVEMAIVRKRNIKKLGKHIRPLPVLPMPILPSRATNRNKMTMTTILAVVIAYRCCSGWRMRHLFGPLFSAGHRCVLGDLKRRHGPKVIVSIECRGCSRSQHRNVRWSPCSHIWHVLVVSQHV